jgi:bacteriocin-like protein
MSDEQRKESEELSEKDLEQVSGGYNFTAPVVNYSAPKITPTNGIPNTTTSGGTAPSPWDVVTNKPA